MSRAAVLVLAGTAEGRAVAQALAAGAMAAPILSLAGLTEAEAPVGVVVRRGGFGGVGGLAAYLRQGRIKAVVDATHPMAARIHHHAVEACRDAGIPCFRVQRREWLPESGDRWQPVADLAAGLDWLRPQARRIFATLGRRALPALAQAKGFHFVVRGMLAPPSLPGNVTWVTGRPPFTVTAEVALLTFHEIEGLFVQASGGELTSAKLTAARERKLPVAMLSRPQSPDGSSGSVADALAWVEGVVRRA